MNANAAKHRLFWPWLLALVGVTAAVFAPVRGFEATNYDDPNYVFTNPNVLRGLTWESIRWAFTTGHASNWHPVTWLSHQADVEMFGPDAGACHLVNLTLHCANVALVFVLFRKLTGELWSSGLIAALFGWHPLHVESVAWIAERKDVLSAFFGLITLLAYAQYAVPSSEIGGGWSSRPRVCYAVTLVSFALGLLSKPMLVSLPAILLLLDFWPFRRLAIDDFRQGPDRQTGDVPGASAWRSILMEKVPFVVLAVASCLVTLSVQSEGGAVRSLEHWTFGDRLANALTATALYLGKTFWPVKLAAFYPLPEVIAWGSVAGAAALLVGITAWALRSVRRTPYRAVGWFWFLIMLVPVIGFVQVGMQQMADRYTYLPLIGVFGLLAWEAAEITRRAPALRNIFAVGGIVIAAACAILTRQQVGHWHDSGTLFRHALAVTERNYLAHNNLGYHLFVQGKTAEAIAQYEAALQINPTYTDAHSNLGRALAEQERYAESAEHFQAVLRQLPQDVIAHNNLGNVLAILGRHGEAIEQFRLALAVKPDHAAAHNNWALSAEALDRAGEAVEHYRAALQLNPNFPAALNNLAWLLATHPDEKVRNGGEALQLAQRACQVVDCSQPAPLLTLAAASAECGQFAAAISLATQAQESARSTGNAAASERAVAMLDSFRQGNAFRVTTGK